jgi:hypothetical protein
MVEYLEGGVEISINGNGRFGSERASGIDLVLCILLEGLFLPHGTILWCFLCLLHNPCEVVTPLLLLEKVP